MKINRIVTNTSQTRIHQLVLESGEILEGVLDAELTIGKRNSVVLLVKFQVPLGDNTFVKHRPDPNQPTRRYLAEVGPDEPLSIPLPLTGLDELETDFDGD